MIAQLDNNITQVIVRVAAHYRVTTAQLSSQERTHEVARARHIAMWILARELKLTSREIGELFNRDHSAVKWACRRLRDEMSVDKRLTNEVTGLIAAAIHQPVAV